MLNFLGGTQIFLAAGATDLRKSFDTLAGVVRGQLGGNPLSGHLYVFCNRGRNRIKILFWDRGGYWVCTKRLEVGTFAWPLSDAPSIQLTPEELTLLLGGIDLGKTRARKWYNK